MSNESKIIIRLWTVTIQSEAVSNAEPQKTTIIEESQKIKKQSIDEENMKQYVLGTKHLANKMYINFLQSKTD